VLSPRAPEANPSDSLPWPLHLARLSPHYCTNGPGRVVDEGEIVSEVTAPSGPPQAEGDGSDDGGNVGKLLVVVNAALVGVPGVYAASSSLAVTLIAAVLAVVLAVLYLRRQRL
jgi:hypothetical protein